MTNAGQFSTTFNSAQNVHVYMGGVRALTATSEVVFSGDCRARKLQVKFKFSDSLAFMGMTFEEAPIGSSLWTTTNPPWITNSPTNQVDPDIANGLIRIYETNPGGFTDVSTKKYRAIGSLIQAAPPAVSNEVNGGC